MFSNVTSIQTNEQLNNSPRPFLWVRGQWAIGSTIIELVKRFEKNFLNQQEAVNLQLHFTLTQNSSKTELQASLRAENLSIGDNGQKRNSAVGKNNNDRWKQVNLLFHLFSFIILFVFYYKL